MLVYLITAMPLIERHLFACDSLCIVQLHRWLLQEDAKLRAALAQQQHKALGGMYDWKAVAAVVGTKTHTQCSRRWRRALCPDLKKGRWTIAEDRKLTELISQGNTKWTALAALLGRTSKQVRTHFTSITYCVCVALLFVLPLALTVRLLRA